MKNLRQSNITEQKRTQSQLDAVESAPCLALVRVGNVSPIKIQIPLIRN